MKATERNLNWGVSLAGVLAAGAVAFWMHSALKDLDKIAILEQRLATLEEGLLETGCINDRRNE